MEDFELFELGDLEDIGLSQVELSGIVGPLLDVQHQDDFEAVCQASGVDVGIAYAVGKNCIEALAASGEDDWLEDLIRQAFGQLSSERQAKFAETGF